MSIEVIYLLVGLMLAGFGLRDAHCRRWGNAGFWLVLGTLFGVGGWLPAWVSGLLVVLLVILDGLGHVKSEPAPLPAVDTLPGWKIVLPILAVPLLTLAVSLPVSYLGGDASVAALLGLGTGSIAAAGVALLVTGSSPLELLEAGRELNETVGPVTILPQLLASLGAVFAAAHVGPWLAGHVQALVPANSVVGMVIANCLGMVALAMLTGNSFAAYPVIATGLTVPILIQSLHGNPAACALLTLTVGASGTLMSPMAVNFNVVPAALLELKDSYRIIRYQLPVALALLVLQVIAMICFI